MLDIDSSDILQVELSGPEKAAALFLVLGKENAVRLANYFSKEEIKTVVDAAGQLRSLNPEAIDQIVQEFGELYSATGLLASSDTLSKYFEEASQSNGMPTSAQDLDVSMLEPVVIKEFFESEAPQIGALLMQKLDEEVAAKIIADLEPHTRNELFKAYLNQNNLEGGLQQEFESDIIELLLDSKKEKDNLDEIEKTASIINQFSVQTSEELVKYIETMDPEAAVIIKKSLFKFSSVEHLSKEHRSILIDGIDSEELTAALSDASEELRDSVLEVVSQRNRRMIEAELMRNAVSKEDAEKVQKQIAMAALKLSREGQIELPDSA